MAPGFTRAWHVSNRVLVGAYSATSRGAGSGNAHQLLRLGECPPRPRLSGPWPVYVPVRPARDAPAPPPTARAAHIQGCHMAAVAVPSMKPPHGAICACGMIWAAEITTLMTAPFERLSRGMREPFAALHIIGHPFPYPHSPLPKDPWPSSPFPGDTRLGRHSHPAP